MKTLALFINLILVSFIATAQIKQSANNKVTTPKHSVSKAPKSSASALTPHEYARQLRASVPPDASFRYYITFQDAADDDITDSLIVLTDTKRIEYLRINRQTGDPAGIAHVVYWPSLRDAAEGKTQRLKGELQPIGPWTVWYDAPGKQKQFELEFDAQGNPIAGSIERWTLDGTPACLEWVEALPSTEKKLGSQTGLTSWARVAIPVDLPANTAAMIVCFDICDNGSPPAIWGSLLSTGMALFTGGASSAVQAGVRFLTPTTQPTGAATNCFYFVTDDESVATHFYQDKVVPPTTSCLFASPGAKREQRAYTLTRPTRRVWVCVENENMRTAAVTSISVKALTDACGNAPK